MKKITLFYCALLACFGIVFQSCETEIKLTGEFEPVPVIFGILDQNDSIHYIKINRSFSGNGNPIESGMTPDSTYWNQVEAYIYEIERNLAGAIIDTTRTWLLRDTLVDNKDTNGIFYAPEQKLYYFISGPNGPNRLKDRTNNSTFSYSLRTILNEGAFVAESNTELIMTDYSGSSQNLTITSPSSNSSFDFAGFPQGNLDYRTDVLQWRIANGELFNVKFILLYDEISGGSIESKELVWNLGEFISENTTGTSYNINLSGEAFYQFVGNNVPDDPSVDSRRVIGVRLEIVAGNEELYKYIQISEPTTSLSQSQPTYSNIDGAFGLWASRSTYSQYWAAYNPASSSLRALSQSSLRALCEGSPYTSNLKFCSNNPADAAQIWYCP